MFVLHEISCELALEREQWNVFRSVLDISHWDGNQKSCVTDFDHIWIHCILKFRFLYSPKIQVYSLQNLGWLYFAVIATAVDIQCVFKKANNASAFKNKAF